MFHTPMEIPEEEEKDLAMDRDLQSILGNISTIEEAVQNKISQKKLLEERSNLYESRIKMSEKKVRCLSDEITKKNKQVSELQSLIDRSLAIKDQKLNLLSSQNKVDFNMESLCNSIVISNSDFQERLVRFELELKHRMMEGKRVVSGYTLLIQQLVAGVKDMSEMSRRLLQDNKELWERMEKILKWEREQKAVIARLSAEKEELARSHQTELLDQKMKHQQEFAEFKVQMKKNMQVETLKKQLRKERMEREKLQRELKKYV